MPLCNKWMYDKLFNFSIVVWCQISVSENAGNVAKCKIKPSETQCLQETFQDS